MFSAGELDGLYYSMEQPNHFPLASENTGRCLRDTWKNRLAGLKHCMPKLSLPWNVIWECVWKWKCITERSRWQESVPKDKRGEEKRSARGLTVVWFDWALYVPQIWRVQPVRYGEQWGGEEQGARDKGGKERDVARRSTGHKQEPEVKDQTRKATQGPREKDQVSQAGAERLKFQESEKGNDWKWGEKIESDNQKELPLRVVLKG